MRRLVLLTVCALVLFSFGCKKEEQKFEKAPPRRLHKPGGEAVQPTKPKPPG